MSFTVAAEKHRFKFEIVLMQLNNPPIHHILLLSSFWYCFIRYILLLFDFFVQDEIKH
jgi:hypothetical protein